MRLEKIFLFGFLFSLVIFSYWQKNFAQKVFLALREEKQLISPLGLSGGRAAGGQVLGEVVTLENDYDFGEIKSEQGVLAQGAIAYDLTNDKNIFAKEPHLRLQAASTLKIVTAAVALDKGKLDEEMTVNYFPTVVGESSMNLAFGEKFTLEELLYGLLLVSGNDAAETIALGLAGKREEFVSWMNDFAQRAGARNTNFTTPSGLDEEGQYTTAWDLFLLGKHIFTKYPLVLEISTTREKYLPKTVGHRSYLLRNKLLLLNDFPISAGKPGLGENGLLSLVALLKKDNRQILVVLIRTPSIRHDVVKILKLL